MNNEDVKDYSNEEVILKVDHLSQYFKLGNKKLHAVDGVTFDIHRGEVFGLVGESGCGKTTTGRTIIKIYDATGGSVYFKGHRIVAGSLDYKENIKAKKAELKKLKADLLAKEAEEINGKSDEEAKAISEKYQVILNDETKKASEYIKAQRAEISKAKHDQKYCDKDYQKAQYAKLKAEYEERIVNASESEKEAINKEYAPKFKAAKHERLVTQIQMIFQDPIASLNPRMTVRDIISEGLVIQGCHDKKYIDEQVYKMLELVGLVKEHAGRYPHEFSGGQRQRIGIARAIVMNPELIIADEPISALDVSIQAQVINLLNDIRKNLGLTILFIAHDLSVVKYFSDRIGVMYFGHLVELASSDELFAHPLHPYTKSLLSAIPLPDPNYEKTRKRFTYNPLAEHDYSAEGPTLREVSPGHFVSCNSIEEAKYKEILANGKAE